METLDQIALRQLNRGILKQLATQISKDLLKLAKLRVPIDTEQLKAALTAKVRESAGSYSIEIFVPNIGRKESNLSNLALGLILEAGGRSGKAKRSQSQPKNPAGSPVARWWTQFVKTDIPEYLKAKGIAYES